MSNSLYLIGCEMILIIITVINYLQKYAFFVIWGQGKRMKFLKITTILTKLPKLLTGVSALD